MSNELIEEIREDVRREELVRIWKKYGNWFIAGALIVIAGTMLGVYWDHHQQQKKIARAHEYENALILLADNKTEEALEALQKIAAGSDKGYALLSLFKQGGLGENSRDALHAIVDNRKIEPQWRELAELILITRELDSENVGGAIQRLEPLLSSNGPWRALASEVMAVALLRIKRIDDAHEILKNLVQDESASQGVRMRTKALLDYIRQN